MASPHERQSSVSLSQESRPRYAPRRPRQKRMRHENRVLLIALLAGSAGTITALILLWYGDYSPRVQWTLWLLIVGSWLGFAFSLRTAVVKPLQTISNMLAALREEDFSLRVRGARHDDALGELIAEANALSDTLKKQRLGAMEAAALLSRVIGEVDVAIFAFDQEQRLRLVNRAGERLMARPMEQLLGHTASELALAHCLEGDSARTLENVFPGKSGRWSLRRSGFRQDGVPHQLLVISDLSRELREEERQAWQRLVRVLGHELNNSLAPVTSLAESLESLMRANPRPDDWQQDMQGGLRIIRERAEALNRFMKNYARLARLPQPHLQPVNVAPLLRRVVSLEARLPVQLEDGPDVTLSADPDQLEQMLINLIRNAVDATLESGGKVASGWRRSGPQLEIWIEDEGPGISNASNLFVPFFTTKKSGSGIGLPLSRQIAEAHGGTLTLENRSEGHGCVATVRLPINSRH
jgi:nitrogen fixation/metabolism regulation signal transduction histidine kinase